MSEEEKEEIKLCKLKGCTLEVESGRKYCCKRHYHADQHKKKDDENKKQKTTTSTGNSSKRSLDFDDARSG